MGFKLGVLICIALCVPSVSASAASSRRPLSRRTSSVLGNLYESIARGGEAKKEESKCDVLHRGEKLCKLHDVIYLPGEMSWFEKENDPGKGQGSITFHTKR